ncbi:hypothetical protein Sgleb_12780 [Streptomyces glebosus]|uniref:Uncharacterized protein n=1 Tax=Streptomyces glebosus TaxID=249580 RepID=A0A640SSJ7_9ACTN|nr:hypothetical protein Sgleb_12780 [Streptomyces glebosus]
MMLQVWQWLRSGRARGGAGRRLEFLDGGNGAPKGRRNGDVGAMEIDRGRE